VRDADAEDAAFRERVARSREYARRGWILASLLWFGFPGLACLALWSVSRSLSGTVSLAVLLLVSISLVAGFEVARRLWRRPPT
jgi:hypothetical protein